MTDETLASPESLLNLMRERRMYRVFKPDPIPDEVLAKVFEAMRWAPSGANSQLWEIIVVRSKDKRKELLDLIISSKVQAGEIDKEFNHPKVGPVSGYVDAPVILVICGDTRFKQRYPAEEVLLAGREEIFGSSLAAAIQNLQLMARSLGLGTIWKTPYHMNEAEIRKTLNLPEYIAIKAFMPLGYIKKFIPPRQRREAEDFIHFEQFDLSKPRHEAEARMR